MDYYLLSDLFIYQLIWYIFFHLKLIFNKVLDKY